ncbi:HNH endonuclease [Flavihumibacter sp. UBA7668]|uniref:HNH endonuclease n=1 Tax=Flavihumibacter sp. UBA7668 TaxID=1946542 RepID=UPI0025BAD83D|nr:HNH endonuclease [Flavihumibacter sp. UBA7668]
MIKIERNTTPIKLTPVFVAAQTAEFITNGTNVWNIDWLKDSLLDLSNGKCAYCECDLKEESKYMEVEHFEDKANNPNKVMEWDNLLPSCKRCNGSKSTHNVITEPIINPFADTPSTHLTLRLFRFKHKDLKGKTTIDVVDLNNTERAVKKRFEVGEQLEKTIEKAQERLELFEENKTIQRKNKLINIMEDILLECQKKSIYSATCSTILHSSDTYLEIKRRMIVHGIWNSDLDELHYNSGLLIL